MKKSFFDDIPQDLLNDPESSSDAIFNAFNETLPDITAIKNRDNYVKSLFKSSGFSKEISVDNIALSTFFISTESATSRSQGFYTPEEEEKLIEIRFIIHNLLPDFERDIMTLIFDYNKIQDDIGVMLGISQAMVNYYKKRAIHRILHFYNHRKIDVNAMRNCIMQYVSKRQLEAMMLYFLKHNQRIISKELFISQSAVSARLKQGLKRLKRKSRSNSEVANYFKIFENLIKQKSLYVSQTKMKEITDVNNYLPLNVSSSKIKGKILIPIIPKIPLKSSKPKSIPKPKIKKIKFTKNNFQKLRGFFKKSK